MDRRKELMKRISALALAAMMMLSMSDFALAEVLAVTETGVQAEQQEQVSDQNAENTGTVKENADNGSEGDGTVTDGDTGQSGSSGDEGPSGSETAGGAGTGIDNGEPAGEGGKEPSEEPAEPEIQNIAVSIAENKDDTMKITWTPVEGAVTYTVTKEVCSAYNAAQTFSEGDAVTETADTEFTFSKLFPGRRYTFSVTAADEEGRVTGTTETPASAQPVITPLTKHGRSSRTLGAARMSFANGSTNLRTYANEAYAGYAVVQGGCTDGTYAYYLMVSPSNQHGKIVKVRMSDRAIVKKSAKLDIWHGNGMTYDSRRHQLVISSRDDPDYGVYRRQQLTCVDADSLTIIGGRQRNVSYSHFASDSRRSYGIASVAYSAKYDVYIADQRQTHDLMVIDPETFEVMGMINTTITAKYPGVYQGMDGDDQYAYQLLSSDGNTQRSNLILALDWNSSQLIDADGHRCEYYAGTWNCTNNKQPVAVYNLNTSYEAENIYHTTDSAGRTHFYLSEYFANPQYMNQTVQEAYKVKWKKVKKKVKVAYKVNKRVKWKKYKTKNGKIKWKYKKVKVTKYKWKKKKVWTYKTKYRTVTKRVQFYDRVDYVYDLGVI